MSKLQTKCEAVINAPVESIWAVITDIDKLTSLNRGAVKATGRMDKQGETRTVEVSLNGRAGTFNERLIELAPGEKTVWTIENDTMGIGKMLKDSRFVTILEKIDGNKTKVTNETYYQPLNFIAKIMSSLMVKPAFAKMQEEILSNLKVLTERD